MESTSTQPKCLQYTSSLSSALRHDEGYTLRCWWGEPHPHVPWTSFPVVSSAPIAVAIERRGAVPSTTPMRRK